ncbi:MAG: DUF3144 domain-containing protein [Asticcacaulis sp.]|uniref:DUF3144 domain-containing protein n=1 Tax=Asticcacaulis sp. TaxID=1872648 RepID=UPI003F7BB80A
MSDEIQEKFVSMASAHIDLANDHNKNTPTDLVAHAINHAAARYAAFSVSLARADRFVLDREEIVDSLVEHYREILNQHYDEFVRLAEAKTTAQDA